MFYYLLVALLVLANSTFASEQCVVKDLKGFYSFVKERGPILKEAQKRKLEIASRIDVAKQRPNPQIDFSYLKGDQFGLDVNNYSVSAKHIIEFGSKRDRRIRRAHSFESLRYNEVDLSLYQENLAAILNFQRVAQLEIIEKAIDEAIHTFEKIDKKLSSRRRLNPEDTVALSTLKLALSDYKAQLNDFQNEKTMLEARLSFLTSCENVRTRYKSFSFERFKDQSNSRNDIGLIELEDLKLDLAQKELEVQKSLGYSDVAVGPSFVYQTQGGEDFLSTGVAVSFSLPLFHTNNGGKLAALRAVNTQKITSDNTKNRLRYQRRRLVEKYHRSLDTLKNTPNLEALESQHKEVEKLFSRGVVSIQMTIESHRQQVEFLKSRFETENDVLTTLGEISLIDGNLTAIEKLL